MDAPGCEAEIIAEMSTSTSPATHGTTPFNHIHDDIEEAAAHGLIERMSVSLAPSSITPGQPTTQLPPNPVPAVLQLFPLLHLTAVAPIPVTDPRPQDRSEIISVKQTKDSGLQSVRALPTSKSPSSSPITPPQQSLPPEFAQVLEHFEDVFPAQLHLGLPPSRHTDHSIGLEPGAKPPAHRIYVICPPEELN